MSYEPRPSVGVDYTVLESMRTDNLAGRDRGVTPLEAQGQPPVVASSLPEVFTVLWPAESSRVQEMSQEEPSVAPVYSSCYHDSLVAYRDSSPPYSPIQYPSPSPGRDGAHYESAILHRTPCTPDPRHGYMVDSTLDHLRQLIVRLHPGSPESFRRFLPRANATLDFLANLGMDGDELAQWEGLCREIEFLIRRMQTLAIAGPGGSLEELRERVRACREAADAAHDELERSSEAIRQHRQRSSGLLTDIDRLSSKIKGLWEELTSAMSCRSGMRTEYIGRSLILQREQRRHRLLHQAMVDAETALTGASETLHVAEAEHSASLNLIFAQIRDVQARLD